MPGGRSGRGAVEDNTRLCEFIYRNLGNITHINATMDTHMTMQVFHAIFFVDAEGNHPAPYTDIHISELREGKWKFNPALAGQFDIAPEYGQQMVMHYAEELQKSGKYDLTIWPYHAMLGGIGHALVRQRRDLAGLVDGGDGVRRREHRCLRVPDHHPRARRRHRDWNAGRRGQLPDATALPEGR